MQLTKESVDDMRCFSIFNISRDKLLDHDEINKIYKRLIMLSHPDKGGSEEDAKAIN